MPLYDCGDPECDECQRAFGPDRREAIARYEKRAREYAAEAYKKAAQICDDADRQDEIDNGAAMTGAAASAAKAIRAFAKLAQKDPADG